MYAYISGTRASYCVVRRDLFELEDGTALLSLRPLPAAGADAHAFPAWVDYTTCCPMRA